MPKRQREEGEAARMRIAIILVVAALLLAGCNPNQERESACKVARLVAAHGADAKLTDLLVTLANCEKARSVSVHDRCKAKFEGFSFRA